MGSIFIVHFAAPFEFFPSQGSPIFRREGSAKRKWRIFVLQNRSAQNFSSFRFGVVVHWRAAHPHSNIDSLILVIHATRRNLKTSRQCCSMSFRPACIWSDSIQTRWWGWGKHLWKFGSGLLPRNCSWSPSAPLRKRLQEWKTFRFLEHWSTASLTQALFYISIPLVDCILSVYRVDLCL